MMLLILNNLTRESKPNNNITDAEKNCKTCKPDQTVDLNCLPSTMSENIGSHSGTIKHYRKSIALWNHSFYHPSY